MRESLLERLAVFSGYDRSVNSNAPEHSDTTATPVLTGETRIRDAATGMVQTTEEWIADCMSLEKREHQECMDALINGIARGDLTAE